MSIFCVFSFMVGFGEIQIEGIVTFLWNLQFNRRNSYINKLTEQCVNSVLRVYNFSRDEGVNRFFQWRKLSGLEWFFDLQLYLKVLCGGWGI